MTSVQKNLEKRVVVPRSMKRCTPSCWRLPS
jgi:hypothetical protein